MILADVKLEDFSHLEKNVFLLLYGNLKPYFDHIMPLNVYFSHLSLISAEPKYRFANLIGHNWT